VDRAKIDNRADVLAFTTSPLDCVLPLFGDVALDLAVVSDRSAFDLAYVLSRVDAEGCAIQIAEGYRSLLDHRAGDRITLSLRKTCATLRPGERLRLSIAAAAFPAYPVNPGTGQRPADAPRSEARLITIGIITGGTQGSTLHLTVAPEEKGQDDA
jgi:putative CocE/NonD family hydrolase